MVLLGFPHFSATELHNKTNATRRTAWKKFALAERQRARNFLIFRCGCKQETLGCKRLKIKRRISFATRLISLRPSHANFDFLFSNFAVRDFILFTLDFNTQSEMRFNRKLQSVLMRSAFCRGVKSAYCLKPLKFAGLHNHSPLLTLMLRTARQYCWTVLRVYREFYPIQWLFLRLAGSKASIRY